MQVECGHKEDSRFDDCLYNSVDDRRQIKTPKELENTDEELPMVDIGLWQ